MSSIKENLQYLLRCQPLWQAGLVVSVLGILYLATTSSPYPIPSTPSDKINHLLAFIHLAVVTRLAWPHLSRISVAVGVMALGLLIELTQSQLPHREFSLLDLTANGAGTAIGLLPCRFLSGRQRIASGR